MIYSDLPFPALGIKFLALLFIGGKVDSELAGAYFFIFVHVQKILIIQQIYLNISCEQFGASCGCLFIRARMVVIQARNVWHFAFIYFNIKWLVTG